MKPQIHAEEQRMTTHAEAIVTETGMLAQSGFTAEEILTLPWLRQWYQTGGSDRIPLIRHWEFLKVLLMTGRLAV